MKAKFDILYEAQLLLALFTAENFIVKPLLFFFLSLLSYKALPECDAQGAKSLAPESRRRNPRTEKPLTVFQGSTDCPGKKDRKRTLWR